MLESRPSTSIMVVAPDRDAVDRVEGRRRINRAGEVARIGGRVTGDREREHRTRGPAYVQT